MHSMWRGVLIYLSSPPTPTILSSLKLKQVGQLTELVWQSSLVASTEQANSYGLVLSATLCYHAHSDETWDI